jgi:hypothetical protein
MATFFIHIHTPTSIILDTEGFEFASYAEALSEATESARELMADAVLEGLDISDRHMEITNKEGAVLGRVPFKVAVRPEVRRSAERGRDDDNGASF